MRKLKGWVLATALLLAPFANAQDPAEQERYNALIAELRCLVCQNQSIAESNAPLAADLREQVRQQIRQGRSDAQIAEFLTARYGDFVLYRPPFRMRTWLLWLGPFIALLFAAAAAAWYIRRSAEAATAVAAETPPEPELQRAAIGARAYLGGAFVLLLFGLAWYALAGSWRTQALVDLAKTDPQAAHIAGAERHFERMRERVRSHPDDAEAWAWVARDEMRKQEFAKAAEAFAHANRLSGSQNPDWLVAEGEALSNAQGGELAGTARERFDAALALAPMHPRALWFGGLAAYRAGDRERVATLWGRLLQQDLPAELREPLARRVAEMGGSPEAASEAATGVRLEMVVNLAPELAGKVAPGSTLLVYALEPDGPRMPLAVHRQPAGAGPWVITLDDSKSMLPNRKLSSLQRWKVLARISRTGDATPQPGDLQGEVLVSAEQAGQRHRLLIDTVR